MSTEHQPLTTDAVVVRLLGVPRSLLELNRRQNEMVLREFQLIELDEQDQGSSPPTRLLVLASALRQAYERLGFSGPAVTAREDTSDDDEDATVDIELPIPAGGGRAVRRLRAAMDEADEWCERGDLLALVTPPDGRALRDWVFDEITRQLEGQPPKPWSGG
jgi:hypothetical protein